MGIQVECPKCKTRDPIKRDFCKCGHNVKKAVNKAYWIECYFEGRRRRERRTQV